MKKLLAVCLFVMLVCFVFTGVSRATIIETGDDSWWVGLGGDDYQSFTCVAHYVWGGVEFTQAPVIGPIYYQPDILNTWQTEISQDNTTVYLYGPQVTNSGPFTAVLSYQLYYQWDIELVDPEYPVYVDTAIYDGPLGSEPIATWGWRGTPGDPDSWEYREVPYVQDEEWYEEDFFTNPAPEITTLSLFGFGILFLRKRRRV
jgi:hypothetical protein